MNDQQRQAVQRSNQTRNMRCGRCGSLATTIQDGRDVGGLPGLRYRHCNGCGWASVIKARRKKAQL